MTLGRQLFLLMTPLLLLVLGGTWLISLSNTRAYLSTQLQSHAQDAATSLGLSLSPHVERGDMAYVRSIVDALFDRGYYQQIALQDMDGNSLLSRERPLKVQGVPQWFVSLVPLPAPQAEALVMAGWRQAGRVRVRSHPGYAYGQLWAGALDTLAWSGLSLLLAVAALVGVLRLVLRPLRALEQQALAIAEREFEIQHSLPRTRELRSAALAMNTMAAKLERTLAKQTDMAEQLRQEAYVDRVTRIGNRRSFDARLDQLTDPASDPRLGALLLVRISDLEVVNREHGFVAGDDLLRSAAEAVHDGAQRVPGAYVARIGGAELGVLVPDLPGEEADALAEALVRELGLIGTPDGAQLGFHVGVAYYVGRESARQLLSAADMALRRAQEQGRQGWHAYGGLEAGDAVRVHGAAEWRRVLLEAVDQKRIALRFQLVRSLQDDEPMHYEVLARLPSVNGELVPAGVFVPMAERAGLGPDLDQLVVQSVLERLGASGRCRCAVNLSPTSVSDGPFAHWLHERLSRSPDLGPRLLFEVSEYTATSRLPELGALIERLAPVGVRFSVDQFGVGSTAFGFLRGLKLDYLKLDASLVRDVQDSRDNQFFIRVIAEITHGLDMQLIASAVESEAELRAVQSLGVDGVQGYHVGEPGDQPG